MTTDGVTRSLEAPFFVLATQNPIENAGTFPLPEAQMDRFLMRLSLGMPDKQEELLILERFRQEEPLQTLETVAGVEDIRRAQREYRQIYVHPQLKEYLVEICQKTRHLGEVLGGVSPRGTIAFTRQSGPMPIFRAGIMWCRRILRSWRFRCWLTV